MARLLPWCVVRFRPRLGGGLLARWCHVVAFVLDSPVLAYVGGQRFLRLPESETPNLMQTPADTNGAVMK